MKVERHCWWGHLTRIIILAAVIEILRRMIAAGTGTFFVKVKAHRGEPVNERADILKDKAISDPKVGKEWCQRTNRAVFSWEKLCREAGKVTYQDRHSTINNSVRMQYEEWQQRMKCKT